MNRFEGHLWANRTEEIDWSVQIAMLAHAVMFGLIMAIVVSVFT